MTAAEPLYPVEAPPVWSLEDLYRDRSDPRIQADLDAARSTNLELAQMSGCLEACRADPAQLGAQLDLAISLYEQATDDLWRVGAFASLGASTARDDADWSRFESDMRSRSAEIGALSLFLPLEINRLSDSEINAACDACPAAARWRPWIRRVRAHRPHELSAELEHFLIDHAPAQANWMRLYDETLGTLSVEAGSDRLTLAAALARLADPDRGRRAEAAAGLSAALAERQSVLALCYNTLALEKQTEDRWRHHARPIDARNLANEIEPLAVEALVSAVSQNYQRLSHRYYALKARALGLDRLEHWDRNAPMPGDGGRLYGWSEARDLILQAFGDLSADFANRARRMFDQPWIDASPRSGKQSGAYCHPVTSRHHPYVFLNFTGERRDVLTLAHELGHAVHQQLAAPLGTMLADTPLTLAETASIFGESLVFDRLLADASPQAQLALLAGRIEDGLNTVVRQIAFHQFESRVHDERRSGELSTDRLAEIWLEVMAASLGPAFRLGSDYGVYWSYVSHFVHAPFYVYAYAFGDLLVRALIDARDRDPQGFSARYTALLSAGGTRTCVEALADFGLDPREETFWAGGCRQLERLIDAFEQACSDSNKR